MDVKTTENTQHDPLEGVTAEGMIITGAHSTRIVLEFIPLIDKAVRELGSLTEASSLYLYGSVATGTARRGHSDVDLVSIDLDPSIARTLSEALSIEFSHLCRSVEIGPGQSSNYLGLDDESYGNRVFLRHYCVHLAGPDIRASLPDFAADELAARGFNGDIGIHAEKWRTELVQDGSTALLARRIGRKTLYAAGSLVSIHDHTWTTDRVAATQRWGEVRPELADGLRTLLSWSSTVFSAPTHAEIQIVIDGVVAKVVDDFAQRIGLWTR